MKCKVLSVMLLVFLSDAVSSAQTSYKGLVPGKSEKVAVETVLGQPVKQLSQTLVEYRPQPLAGRIYVQYRADTSVVERMEFICRLAESSCKDFMKSLNLSLPESAAAMSPPDNKGRYLAFSAPPYYVVQTMEWVVETENADLLPVRVAFYSRELYQAEVGKIKKAQEAAPAEAVETPPGRKPIDAATGSVINSNAQERGATSGTVSRSTEPGVSVSGRWSGPWTNDKGESGNSTVNITELAHGEIIGDEDGWAIEDGYRSGNVLTWVYRNKRNGCRGYAVRWEISPDGREANGTYRVIDGCEKKDYNGKYLHYHR